MSPEKTGAPGESQYGSVKVIAKLLGVSQSYLKEGHDSPGN